MGEGTSTAIQCSRNEHFFLKRWAALYHSLLLHPIGGRSARLKANKDSGQEGKLPFEAVPQHMPPWPPFPSDQMSGTTVWAPALCVTNYTSLPPLMQLFGMSTTLAPQAEWS